MGYAMPATLSFCVTGGAALFLDTNRNRYFRLARRPDTIFRRLVESGGALDAVMEPFLRLGVLHSIPEAGARLNQAAAPTPSRSIVEQRQVSPSWDGRL